MSEGIEFHLKEYPVDLINLSWQTPLEYWDHSTMIEVEKGLSRHTVIFLEFDDIYVIKELPQELARKEYKNLRRLNHLDLPVVEPVGYILINKGRSEARSIIITRFLSQSIPYRVLFMRHGLSRYQGRLLDALAILLVNLHLNNFFWGDCSLSNVLFRRDAGELQAYLVDTETSDFYPSISKEKRLYDLEIMSANVYGDLLDLQQVVDLPEGLEIETIGDDIISRYHSLWDKINQDILIDPSKQYEVHDYIKSINSMGFSVDKIELVPTLTGNKLQLRTIVTDRNYHRHLLQNLTGIVAEEHQAQLILNDIREYKVMISQKRNRSVSLHVSAHSWLGNIYLPVVEEISPHVTSDLTPPEIFCQILENKWFLSEEEKDDVGMLTAVNDYLHRLQKNEIL